MIRLFGSELLRFRSRRLVLILLLASVAVALIAAVIAGFQSTPPGAAALANARIQADREYENCLEGDWEEIEIEGSLEDFCRQNFGNPAFYLPSHLALVDLPSILEGTASITSIVGLVLGASLMAVSWQTGTINTILTWEPRRARWYTSRILVTVVGVFVVVLAIVVFLSASLAVAAWLRGSVEGVDGAWWRDTTATSLRIGVVAAIAAAIGAGVAAAGQRTAAALGVVFVYTAVLEGLLRAFRPRWTPWLLGDNLVSFVSWQSNSEVFEAGSFVLTPGRAAFVIAGYAALAFLLGLASVRLRDVQ
jgi:hypothetical protein